MLTPEQIEELRQLTDGTIRKLTDWILRDVCRRTAEAGTITSTAEYQLWRAKMLGITKKELKKELLRRLNVTEKELQQSITESAKLGYKMDVERLKATDAVPFEQNKEIQQILWSAKQLTDEDFNNITQTIGFVMPNGKAGNLTQAYQKACDFAHMQVATGVTDYASAVRNATRNLLRYGIRTIDYESGIHTNLEAAVRRSVFGGIGLMQEKISEQNHEDLGADGWELSAHAMSAPDHEPYQGRQYTDAQYQALNDSLQRRIGTLNCGHIAFPIIIGVSEPVYTPEQLQKFKNDNKKGVNYQGKHYTQYEATQKQRAIERAIRAQKRKILREKPIADASGDDTALKAAKAKLTLLNAEYNKFSKAVGLRPQYARTDIGVNV